jgi:hypothetical protein
MPTQFEIGLLVGLLVGEGHFGGDGRQPQVTLRMHVRHEATFRWLERTFPGGRVYGPYHHDGRDYLQWMARGPFLRDELTPLLDRLLSPSLDRHSFDRFQLMKTRYPQLATVDEPATGASPDSAETGSGRAAHRPAQANGRRSTPSRSGRPASSRSGRTARETRDPDTFADLFSQLREAWPS